MKRNALSALIALSLLGGSAVAQAQDFGNWYIAPRIGAVIPDSNRETDTSVYGGFGVGVWVNPHLAVDFEYGINNASFKDSSWRPNREWESVTLGVSARWFFGDEGSQFRPYVMAGLGAQRHTAYSGSLSAPPPNPHLNGNNSGWDPMATVGGGVQYNMSENMALRGEIAARYDKDNNTRGNISDQLGYGISHKSGYIDGIVTVGLVYSFGHAAPPAPVAPAAPPAAPDCHTLDDDHDGVNNCDDRCPDTPAGTIVGPDGCPQKVVIDLRGVNFKFDRPKKGEHKIEPTLAVPTVDSVAILDQAIDALNRYPQIKVELDGHTDSIGTDQYNQGLSERRAQIVSDYLTAHGISADRITAVKGFGESQPIDTNSTKEGRARNRRTELKVENPGQ